jgi:hypothetical protein
MDIADPPSADARQARRSREDRLQCASTAGGQVRPPDSMLVSLNPSVQSIKSVLGALRDSRKLIDKRDELAYLLLVLLLHPRDDFNGLSQSRMPLGKFFQALIDVHALIYNTSAGFVGS